MLPAIDQFQYVTRRAFQRVQIDCDAQLVTPGSYRAVRLRDLSRSGARLEMENPPPEGTTALLRWFSHESLCTVVWTSPIACGVSFVRPIAEEVVGASCGSVQTKEDDTPARLTQITFGKRRLRRRPVLVLNEESEPEGYNWTIVLMNPPDAPKTAAEEMFFFGSPIAHIALREYCMATGQA